MRLWFLYDVVESSSPANSPLPEDVRRWRQVYGRRKDRRRSRTRRSRRSRSG
jgi:hypothetical protein